MYKVAYLGKDIELLMVDEIINLVTYLVKNSFNTSPFLLSITLPNKDIISFGIGATPNHIMLFFKPYSSLEDCKISCDTSLTYDCSPVIKFLYPHSTHRFECNEYNLLPMDVVFPHIHTLLIEGDLSSIPCYSH